MVGEQELQSQALPHLPSPTAKATARIKRKKIGGMPGPEPGKEQAFMKQVR